MLIFRDRNRFCEAIYMTIKNKVLFIGRVAWAIIAFGFGICALSAQNIDRAKLYYEAGQWQQAIHEVEQLFEANARNLRHAELNRIYGESLLQLGQYERSLAPLQKAQASQAEAVLLQAKALIALYRFDEAESLLQKSVKRFRLKEQSEESLHLLDRTALGSRMLDKCERVEVIDSVVFDRADLLDRVQFDSGAGLLQQSQSLGLESVSDSVLALAYINGTNDYSIFARQEDELSMLDLYEAYLLGASWAEERALTALNSSSNENYPTMRADGMTLFFASDRPSGLGGYDLYLSRLDPVERRYLAPTQLGMPFNSPFNDYLIAYDEELDLGFFVSDRYMPADSLVLYTFVLNEAYVPMLSEDMEQKRAQASLRQIARTQDAASAEEYSRLLSKLRAKERKAQKQVQTEAIHFVLQGERVYKLLSDFKNSKSASLFAELQNKRKSHSDRLLRLEQLRQSYAEASGGERKRIGQEILRLEELLPKQEQELQRAEKEIRAVELGRN